MVGAPRWLGTVPSHLHLHLHPPPPSPHVKKSPPHVPRARAAVSGGVTCADDGGVGGGPGGLSGVPRAQESDIHRGPVSRDAIVSLFGTGRRAGGALRGPGSANAGAIAAWGFSSAVSNWV